jgi:hypothetical protein
MVPSPRIGENVFAGGGGTMLTAYYAIVACAIVTMVIGLKVMAELGA